MLNIASLIIGLVALSTLMVVYLAAEPTRRGDETTEQENTALVRGTDLYITYCLQCHGPAGTGGWTPGLRRKGCLEHQGMASPARGVVAGAGRATADDTVTQRDRLGTR